MSLAVLGLSHRSAPVDVRERHAFPAARSSEALIALCDYGEVREAALLSTCNRLEIYADLDDLDAGIAQLKEFLANFRHGGLDYDMEPYLYALTGDDAVRHFLRVATGLDSMMIGEAEILGQVKGAYLNGHRAGSVGKVLHRLFRHALRAGKEARSQTAIGHASVSIATAAIDLAKAHVGALRGKRILVVGTGKMGATAAKRLKLEGARIVLANRTHERASELAAKLGVAEVVEMPTLVDAMVEADIVITSTGAPHFVLGVDNVGRAMESRPGRPLHIVDIAVPRDVDPAVCAIPGVLVSDIDQLGAAVDATLDVRRLAVPAVMEIVEEHVAQFGHWYALRAAEPVISLLAQRAELIREAEIERLFARCPALSTRERLLMTGASLTIISRLLHTAFARMHDESLHGGDDAERHAQALDELFELHAHPDAEPSAGYAPPL